MRAVAIGLVLRGAGTRECGISDMQKRYEKISSYSHRLVSSHAGGGGHLSADGRYSSTHAAHRENHRRQSFSKLSAALLAACFLHASPSYAQSDEDARRDAFFKGAEPDKGVIQNRRTADGPPRSLELSPLVSKDITEKFGEVRRDKLPESLKNNDEDDSVITEPSLLPEDVLVAELSDWDIAASGLLSEGQGGLPADLWGDASVLDAMEALDSLPVAASSPTMQSLMERLLLTAANPPANSEGRGWDFVLKRLELIEARGDVLALAAMLDTLPIGQGPQELAAMRADAYFRAGDIASACMSAKRALNGENTPYWLETVIACRAMEGDSAGARLALDALKEERRPDPFYETLLRGFLNPVLASLDVTASPPRIWPEGQSATPLLLALAEAASVPLPQAHADMDAITLQTLALAPTMPPAKRLLPAEMMAARAVFPADKLSAIALSTPLQFEGAKALGLDEGLAGRIAAFQAAVAASDPALKLAALRDLWRAADEAGAYTAWALASRDIAESIEPAPFLIDGSIEMTRVLALSGAHDRVIDWYRVARVAAVPAPELGLQDGRTDVLLNIWPLALVLDQRGQVPFSARIVDLWWQAQSDRPLMEQAERAVLFFSLLEAMDLEVPAESWGLLAGLGAELALPAAGGVDWDALVNAVDTEAVGPTVAYAMKAIGEDGPAGADANTLREVVRGLRSIGLVREAQSLAVEALIAKGF